MPDPLADVLRYVEEGRLSPEEAAPIIAALADKAPSGSTDRGQDRGPDRADRGWGSRDRAGEPPRLRVRVTDKGHPVVDVQVPGVLAELAATLPGIPATYLERVREALRRGTRGPIVNVHDEDGDGLTIEID